MHNTIPSVLTGALAVAMIGCSGPTGLKGRVTMRPDQAGNVQGCRVRLYSSPDLSGIPVRETTSSVGDSSLAASEFEITSLPAGDYYVLAWKDRNLDSLIGNLDLIGVYGDTYAPGHGGTQVRVRDGQVNDSADVALGVYHQLTLKIIPIRHAPDTLDFVYRFNNTVTLTLWSLQAPWGAKLPDPSQNGSKLANIDYHAFITGANNTPPPGGDYAVLATGQWQFGPFRDSIVLSVPEAVP